MNVDIMGMINNMTSQSTKGNKVIYKCDKCQDTGWIENNGYYKRCECYNKEVSISRWKKFGVNPDTIKKLREYEDTTEIQKRAKSKAAEYITNFRNIQAERNNSFALLGQPGAGKTHIALSIGKAIMCTYGIDCVYMPYLEAIRELKAATMSEDIYFKIQNKYTKCSLLILDDLFKDKVKHGKLTGELNESDMKHIYPIINQRYISQRPTIYSSECNAEMIMDLDEALAGRILETTKNHLVIFKYNKENNYRLKDI